MKLKIIHLYWEGPYKLEELTQLKDDIHDYGIYQIYGCHPVYGSDVLMYIGKADKQTFGVRIGQENWSWNRDSGKIQIYVGRLMDKRKPTNEEWSKEIGLAEKLLIYSHTPASNTQNLNSIPETDIEDVHVLNWGQHRDLMAEVSGVRWTSKYNIDEFKIY